jgi:hypothetical protein
MHKAFTAASGIGALAAQNRSRKSQNGLTSLEQTLNDAYIKIA